MDDFFTPEQIMLIKALKNKSNSEIDAILKEFEEEWQNQF